MLAGNFYNMSKRGGKASKRGTIDAPKLSAGPSTRGRGRGRGFAPPRPIAATQNDRPTTSKNRGGGRGGRGGRVDHGVPPVRQLDYEEYDESDEDNDSEKENEQPNNNANEVDSAEDEEDESEDEWKYKLLEIIQQYVEVYDLAHPRYKDKDLRKAAWDEIAIGMGASGKYI